MRVMVIIQASPESEANQMPSEQAFKEMGAFNDELIKAGIMLSGEGLQPSSTSKRVVWRGEPKEKPRVVDGPFTESKELVAGFWIWKVKSMDEAVAWAQRIPNPDAQAGTVELRPVQEMEDFGDAMTPELRAQEERQRAELARRAQGA
jgi:hypothetical protein